MKRLMILVCFFVTFFFSYSCLYADEDTTITQYLHSEYMTCPLNIKEVSKIAYRIQLTLDFASNMATGTGVMLIDPNSCWVNEFGDTETCTKMNYDQVKFKFDGIKLADPNKTGRTIYAIDLNQTDEKDSIFLIMPKDMNGEARIVYHYDKESVMIIYLKNGPFQYM